MPIPARTAQTARTAGLVAAGVVVGFALALAPHAVSSWESPDEEASVSLEDLRLFSKAFALIKRRYVDQVDDSLLMRNAIRGMVNNLDPYTAHLDGSEFDAWETSTTGKFGGLGIVITKKNIEDPVRVISPIDDTPAQRAGIRSGDLILEIDTERVSDMHLNEAARKLRGEPGSSVDLLIQREGAEEPFTLTLERAIIKTKSVRSHVIEPGYAYLRISNFRQPTAQSFREHLVDVLNDEAGRPQGLILDLRNNPGGILQSAVEVSGFFLDDGTLIVSTRGRTEDSNLTRSAVGADLAHDIPIVVLINRGSASASEIVAGALQDNARATVLGERSFGKGSVQEVLPFKGEKVAIKLTVSRYYTPSGSTIHEKGIQPDHEVAFAASSDPDAVLAEDYSNLLEVDNQVRAALTLLKTGSLPAETQPAQASTESPS